MYSVCGCYYYLHEFQAHRYLPLIETQVQSTILSTTSCTTLVQTFINPSTSNSIDECNYMFPLFDGVSVVKFTCKFGNKVLRGVVKEKEKAKKEFEEAKSRGETAGLLHMNTNASDVFMTKLGNIPANERVVVEITYISELKHHGADGTRFTIPTHIAPRYGSNTISDEPKPSIIQQNVSGINITIDIHMADGSYIKQVESPSHPISVAMGINTLSISPNSSEEPSLSKACASLSLDSPVMEKDFVVIIHAKEMGVPKAVCETHPTIPNHYAIMTSLAPRFNLPSIRPEIVFVADRSGSMSSCIPMLVSAMNVFLKSLPTGVKFNICSFGSTCSFLWRKSKIYSQVTLDEATKHLNSFSANMGGTETYQAIKATIEQRFTDLPLEIMLLTDGDIWQQEELFSYLNEQVSLSNGGIRVFPLGIGRGVSHSLIEGVARAGNGFAQAVQDGERLDAPVVRMLRGALSPHITNYTLELKYDEDMEAGSKKVLSGEYEMVQSVQVEQEKKEQPTISLYDPNFDPEKVVISDVSVPLPHVPVPKILQAPTTIPPLFPTSKTTVYLLMSDADTQPSSIILQASSAHGPLKLEIPIERLEKNGETIHQLAARKAVQDLEEGRGWLSTAVDEESGLLVKNKYPSSMEELVKLEGVRLGEKFQVVGKWCSFVAVSKSRKDINASNDYSSNMSIQKDRTSNGSEDDSDEFDDYVMDVISSSTAHQQMPKLVGGSRRVYKCARKHVAAPRMSLGSTSSAAFQMQQASIPRGGNTPFQNTYAPPQCAAVPRSVVSTAAPGSFGSTAAPGSFGSTAALDSFGSAATSNSTHDKVMALINLQKFEGYWSCTLQELSSILNLTLPNSPDGIDHNMWLTYIVIHFLEEKCAAESDIWELVVEKARDWIQAQGLFNEKEKMIKNQVAQLF